MDHGLEDLDERSGERRRRRRSKHKHKRRSRKHQKLIDNLIWIGWGLGIGLQLLTILLYVMSRY